MPQVIKSILGQKEHHRKISFKEELERIFDKAEIDYDEKYMMKGCDENA